MFLCICSASFKLLLLRLRFRQPCIASDGHTTSLVSSPQRATRCLKKVLESARRRLEHKKSKKSPMTLLKLFIILLKLFQSLDGSLVDTRFMTMAHLSYAGFLRRLKDVFSHSTYFELFIESSSARKPFSGFYFLRPVFPVLCILSSS